MKRLVVLMSVIALGTSLWRNVRLLEHVNNSMDTRVLDAPSLPFPSDGDVTKGVATINGNNRTCGIDGKKPLAVIHVGPRKTGTTSVQNGLWMYQDDFEKDGMNVLVTHHHKISKCVLYNERKRARRQLEGDGCKVHEISLVNGIEDACQKHNGLFFSSEALDGPAAVDVDRIRSLFDGFEVHIVIVYRRLFEWLVSHFGQRYRSGWDDWDRILPKSSRTIVDYLTKARVRERSNDHILRLRESYAAAGFQTHVVNYHQQSDLVSLMFCQDYLNLPHVCQRVSNHTQSGGELRSNQGTPLAFDEIAVAAYEAGWFENSNITRNEARSRIESFITGTMNRTVHELPKRCTDDSLLANLRNGSTSIEAKLFPDFFNSDRGESEIHSKMDAYVKKNTFCAVNTKRVLRWKELKEALQQ